jgi:hypothetical protein
LLPLNSRRQKLMHPRRLRCHTWVGDMPSISAAHLFQYLTKITDTTTWIEIRRADVTVFSVAAIRC